MCKNKFKRLKYKGCHASDKKPHMYNGDCCILNTDDSTGNGVHWISLVKHRGKIIAYDSFGRETSTLSHNFPEKWKETKDNVEQHILEVNCGMRSIAFLQCCDLFGVDQVIKYI